MKLLIIMALVSTFSSVANSSTKTDEAKALISQSLSSPFLIRNYNAYEYAARIIDVSLESVDISTLRCSEIADSPLTECLVNMSESGKSTYKVRGLVFLVSENSKSVKNISTTPIESSCDELVSANLSELLRIQSELGSKERIFILSKYANELHASLMADIDASKLTHSEAQERFNHEVYVRQCANHFALREL